MWRWVNTRISEFQLLVFVLCLSLQCQLIRADGAESFFDKIKSRANSFIEKFRPENIQSPRGLRVSPDVFEKQSRHIRVIGTKGPRVDPSAFEEASKKPFYIYEDFPLTVHSDQFESRYVPPKYQAHKDYGDLIPLYGSGISDSEEEETGYGLDGLQPEEDGISESDIFYLKEIGGHEDVKHPHREVPPTESPALKKIRASEINLIPSDTKEKDSTEDLVFDFDSPSNTPRPFSTRSIGERFRNLFRSESESDPSAEPSDALVPPRKGVTTWERRQDANVDSLDEVEPGSRTRSRTSRTRRELGPPLGAALTKQDQLILLFLSRLTPDEKSHLILETLERLQARNGITDARTNASRHLQNSSDPLRPKTGREGSDIPPVVVSGTEAKDGATEHVEIVDPKMEANSSNPASSSSTAAATSASESQSSTTQSGSPSTTPGGAVTSPGSSTTMTPSGITSTVSSSTEVETSITVDASPKTAVQTSTTGTIIAPGHESGSSAIKTEDTTTAKSNPLSRVKRQTVLDASQAWFRVLGSRIRDTFRNPLGTSGRLWRGFRQASQPPTSNEIAVPPVEKDKQEITTTNKQEMPTTEKNVEETHSEISASTPKELLEIPVSEKSMTPEAPNEKKEDLAGNEGNSGIHFSPDPYEEALRKGFWSEEDIRDYWNVIRSHQNNDHRASQTDTHSQSHQPSTDGLKDIAAPELKADDREVPLSELAKEHRSFPKSLRGNQISQLQGLGFKHTSGPAVSTFAHKSANKKGGLPRIQAIPKKPPVQKILRSSFVKRSKEGDSPEVPSTTLGHASAVEEFGPTGTNAESSLSKLSPDETNGLAFVNGNHVDGATKGEVLVEDVNNVFPPTEPAAVGATDIHEEQHSHYIAPKDSRKFVQHGSKKGVTYPSIKNEKYGFPNGLYGGTHKQDRHTNYAFQENSQQFSIPWYTQPSLDLSDYLEFPYEAPKSNERLPHEISPFDLPLASQSKKYETDFYSQYYQPHSNPVSMPEAHEVVIHFDQKDLDKLHVTTSGSRSHFPGASAQYRGQNEQFVAVPEDSASAHYINQNTQVPENIGYHNIAKSQIKQTPSYEASFPYTREDLPILIEEPSAHPLYKTKLVRVKTVEKPATVVKPHKLALVLPVSYEQVKFPLPYSSSKSSNRGSGYTLILKPAGEYDEEGSDFHKRQRRHSDEDTIKDSEISVAKPSVESKKTAATNQMRFGRFKRSLLSIQEEKIPTETESKAKDNPASSKIKDSKSGGSEKDRTARSLKDENEQKAKLKKRKRSSVDKSNNAKRRRDIKSPKRRSQSDNIKKKQKRRTSQRNQSTNALRSQALDSRSRKSSRTSRSKAKRSQSIDAKDGTNKIRRRHTTESKTSRRKQSKSTETQKERALSSGKKKSLRAKTAKTRRSNNRSSRGRHTKSSKAKRSSSKSKARHGSSNKAKSSHRSGSLITQSSKFKAPKVQRREAEDFGRDEGNRKAQLRKTDLGHRSNSDKSEHVDVISSGKVATMKSSNLRDWRPAHKPESERNDKPSHGTGETSASP